MTNRSRELERQLYYIRDIQELNAKTLLVTPVELGGTTISVEKPFTLKLLTSFLGCVAFAAQALEMFEEHLIITFAH
jgi:hypothetical protein